MTPQSLQTVITLGAVLTVLGHVEDDSGCLDGSQVRQREENFSRRVPLVNVIDSDRIVAPSTCEQAALEATGEVSDRALSPWTYRVDRDANRHPPEIYMAVCLCRGCILNQKESHDYNSQLIYANQRVLKKSRCKTNPNKYNVTREWIRVTVGCTCVRPNVQESW